VSHRLPTARAALKAGFEVHVARVLTATEGGHRGRRVSTSSVVLGARQSRSAPDFPLVRDFHTIYRRVDPNLAHHVA
jgi:hypothetical protein